MPLTEADLNKFERTLRRVSRILARLRFKVAPKVEECLTMLTELEIELGGERRAAEVIGPSIITIRSWKRRRTMAVPSRRLVWLVWAILLHPETLLTVDDLVTWGKFRPVD